MRNSLNYKIPAFTYIQNEISILTDRCLRDQRRSQEMAPLQRILTHTS